ncbi:hypothetical protein ACIP5Y_25590 [Nocardia sp. NPDC088792]
MDEGAALVVAAECVVDEAVDEVLLPLPHADKLSAATTASAATATRPVI